jgi:prophage regulatory protein
VEQVQQQKIKERILRFKEVQHQTGMSGSTIYEQIAKGKFPKQIKLGNRCVGWLESEITGWIESRVSLSRSDV